jgi:hypothetical protein
LEIPLDALAEGQGNPMQLLNYRRNLGVKERFVCECSQTSQTTEQLWILLIPWRRHMKYLDPTVVL